MPGAPLPHALVAPLAALWPGPCVPYRQCSRPCTCPAPAALAAALYCCSLLLPLLADALLLLPTTPSAAAVTATACCCTLHPCYNCARPLQPRWYRCPLLPLLARASSTMPGSSSLHPRVQPRLAAPALAPGHSLAEAPRALTQPRARPLPPGRLGVGSLAASGLCPCVFSSRRSACATDLWAWPNLIRG